MKTLIFFLSFISYSAFAIKGEYAGAKEELPSSCILTFKFFDKSKNKVSEGLCSSSFIGKKTFITADHCLKKAAQALEDVKLTKEAPYFQCPGSSTKHTVKRLKDTSGAKLGSDYDIGLIQVDSDVQVPKLDLPSSSSQANELLKNPALCFINGYGYDNEDKYGVLKAAQTLEVDINPTYLKIRGNTGVHGDSGGPMFCRPHKDAPPVLVGIIHGAMVTSYTELHRVDTITDWIKYHQNGINTSNDRYGELTGMIENCGIIENCVASKLSQDTGAVIKKLNADLKAIKANELNGKAANQKDIDLIWNKMMVIWEKFCKKSN